MFYWDFSHSVTSNSRQPVLPEITRAKKRWGHMWDLHKRTSLGSLTVILPKVIRALIEKG